MNTTDIVMLVLSAVIVGVIFMANKNKRYGVPKRKKDEEAEEDDSKPKSIADRLARK